MNLCSITTLVFCLTLAMAPTNAMYCPSPRLAWLVDHGTSDHFHQSACELSTNDQKDFALQCAGRQRNAAAMMMLMRCGARAYEYDENIFTNAVRTQNHELINELLNRYALVSKEALDHLLIQRQLAILDYLETIKQHTSATSARCCAELVFIDTLYQRILKDLRELDAFAVY